jgi:hypothetical protein
MAAFVCALPTAYVTGLLILGRATGLSAIVPALILSAVMSGIVFYLIARNAIGAVLIGAGLPVALVALFYISLVWSFREHSEKYPKGPVTNTEPLTSFSEFPVYWLGRTYNGLDLTRISAQAGGPGSLHTTMYLTYGYGVCTSKGLEERCSSTPLVLIVEPASAEPRVNCRNYDVLDPYLWTADVSIAAGGTAPPTKRELLRDLSLANASKFPNAKEVGSVDYVQYRGPCANFTPEPTLPVSPPVSPRVSP